MDDAYRILMLLPKEVTARLIVDILKERPDVMLLTCMDTFTNSPETMRAVREITNEEN